MLHDELGTYKYSFALAGVFFIIAVILVVIVRIMNITMSSKRSSTTTTPAKPLLSAKTITSIIATSVNNLTRVASSANRLSSQQQLQQQDDEVAVVVRTLTQAKDVSSSSSTDFAGLQPVWIAGGDDEGIQLPRLELIQVHAENDANSLHQMELTETTSITDGASVTLKPNPSDAAHHLPNSQGPSRLSFVESNHEEPLTAQEVYAEIAAEGVPILEPEKAPIPLEEEEEDEEELALGPDEIEQLLEPEEFPGSCTITPMPASPMPMSSYPGSHRDSWVPGDETSRTPVPEVVICDPWTATPPVLSLSPPSNSLGMDLSPAWTLRHDDLNTALQGHHQREEEAWEPEQAPLLAEAKIKDSSSSELADLEIADSNSQWPSSASDDCTLSYIPLQSIDDPISESSDDSNFLESNQSTIQSCISEADMDLRSLRRLGIDVKQHTNNSSNNN
ncbi:unnamed protein product [Notodromas monacha]|uniref:Uncharacterized protein n=1 Tax=Notodromas monacha TaxID=399045 RepID=A0A7R9BZ58_9CRUS|nr:unnamed protein product [Notodromas monacha]CAG0924365.1 unnamed protein product [Notodromas monacha]